MPHRAFAARAQRLLALATACLMLLGYLGPATADLNRMQRLALERYGPQTASTVAEWRALIDNVRNLSDSEKLEQVNRFFNNRVAWKSDSEIWRQQDYWATPLETLGRELGDCEDFSIAKYMTLMLAGVDIDRMRITYVKARMGAAGSGKYQAHMVLAYYDSPAADPSILDNMIDEIRPASRRPDLKPVFGFNSQGLWVRGAKTPATSDPGARLSRWRDLLQRMAADGLG